MALVKADPIINQPALRDQKIIKSLGKKYSTLVLGWNRRGLELPKEKMNRYGATFKFLNLKAPSGAPSLPCIPTIFLDLGYSKVILASA